MRCAICGSPKHWAKNCDAGRAKTRATTRCPICAAPVTYQELDLHRELGCEHAKKVRADDGR